MLMLVLGQLILKKVEGSFSHLAESSGGLHISVNLWSARFFWTRSQGWHNQSFSETYSADFQTKVLKKTFNLDLPATKLWNNK